MKCIWCRRREATEDLYCYFCANIMLTVEVKAQIDKSFEAAAWRIGKEVETFKQAVKATLPRWLKWMR